MTISNRLDLVDITSVRDRYQLSESEAVEFIRVLNRAATISLAVDSAASWMTESLDHFEGRSPVNLIKLGRAESLMIYLDSLAAGFSG